jgi:hypothetical protein
MTMSRVITRDDILSMDAFDKVRAEKRKDLVAMKKHRRMDVGPVATFYFESYETMWWQVHEMLRIERGGEAQIPDELAAYNSLIPNGRELVATVMFEIDEPMRRKVFLDRIGGVENTAFIQVSEGHRIAGVPEADMDRTTAEGKASSVQFIHFPFDDAAIAAFRTPGTQIVIGFSQENYAHMSVMPEATRAALAEDFD